MCATMQRARGSTRADKHVGAWVRACGLQLASGWVRGWVRPSARQWVGAWVHACMDACVRPSVRQWVRGWVRSAFGSPGGWVQGCVRATFGSPSGCMGAFGRRLASGWVHGSVQPSARQWVGAWVRAAFGSPVGAWVGAGGLRLASGCVGGCVLTIFEPYCTSLLHRQLCAIICHRMHVPMHQGGFSKKWF